MAAKTAKKTTRKTTARKTEPKTEEKQETPVSQKSCAYPSCSARATKEFGANNVPSCDIHATIFENQAEDGAGIQQLMESYVQG